MTGQELKRMKGLPIFGRLEALETRARLDEYVQFWMKTKETNAGS